LSNSVGADTMKSIDLLAGNITTSLQRIVGDGREVRPILALSDCLTRTIAATCGTAHVWLQSMRGMGHGRKYTE
jgi:hypothetical protein